MILLYENNNHYNIIYPKFKNAKNNIIYNYPKEIKNNINNSNITKITFAKKEQKYISVNYNNSKNIYNNSLK